MTNSAAALTLALLPACAFVNYDAVSENGQFTGRLFVMWVGEGSPFEGDGRFVFVPNPRDPLTFTRVDEAGTVISAPISPEMMYTDGGSIPRIATVFRGLSPWGYAPAYMIHDWLFIAKHCITDGTPSDEQAKIDGMTFQTSALIIAEAIKTLQVSGQVSKDDVAARAVSFAVGGPISRGKWTLTGACEGHAVSEEHRLAALAAFPRDMGADGGDVGLRSLGNLDDALARVDRPAIIIGEFGF